MATCVDGEGRPASITHALLPPPTTQLACFNATTSDNKTMATLKQHVLCCGYKIPTGVHVNVAHTHSLFGSSNGQGVAVVNCYLTYTYPAVTYLAAAQVKGDTASERLDMRAATKADKFCK